MISSLEGCYARKLSHQPVQKNLQLFNILPGEFLGEGSESVVRSSRVTVGTDGRKRSLDMAQKMYRKPLTSAELEHIEEIREAEIRIGLPVIPTYRTVSPGEDTRILMTKYPLVISARDLLHPLQLERIKRYLLLHPEMSEHINSLDLSENGHITELLRDYSERAAKIGLLFRHEDSISLVPNSHFEKRSSGLAFTEHNNSMLGLKGRTCYYYPPFSLAPYKNEEGFYYPIAAIQNDNFTTLSRLPKRLKSLQVR